MFWFMIVSLPWINIQPTHPPRKEGDALYVAASVGGAFFGEKKTPDVMVVSLADVFPTHQKSCHMSHETTLYPILTG